MGARAALAYRVPKATYMYTLSGVAGLFLSIRTSPLPNARPEGSLYPFTSRCPAAGMELPTSGSRGGRPNH